MTTELPRNREYAEVQPDAEIEGILGAALIPISPPEDLRAHLLEIIEEMPQDPPPIQAGESSEVVSSLRMYRQRRVLPWLIRAAAAVVVLAVGVGIGRWTAMDSVKPTTYYAKLNQMQDVRRIEDTMPDGHVVTLTWSPEMEMAAVTMPDMQTEDDESLQVWMRDDNTIRSAGMYAPKKGTVFSFIDVMPAPGLDVFITVEPRGGSRQPTSDPIVVLHVVSQGGDEEPTKVVSGRA